MSYLKPIVISPPFGNYVCLPNATRIRGTFTCWRREGLLRNALKTIRPVKDGWVNRMELCNPGIVDGLRKGNAEDDIYSIGIAESKREWNKLHNTISLNHKIEVNVGCPNVREQAIQYHQLKAFARYKFTSLKVPPISDVAWKYIQLGYDAGIKVFHIANTIPVERGGESGRAIQEISLPLIEKTKTTYGEDIAVIGGGGIYSPEDVYRYYNAGADVFSLATVWFTPWRIPAIIKEVRKWRRKENLFL